MNIEHTRTHSIEPIYIYSLYIERVCTVYKLSPQNKCPPFFLSAISILTVLAGMVKYRLMLRTNLHSNQPREGGGGGAAKSHRGGGGVPSNTRFLETFLTNPL